MVTPKYLLLFHGSVIGECVISLQPLLSGVEQTFELVLTHLGSETGTLKLLIHMVLPDESSFMSSTKGKIYDLISIADEESACSNTTSLVSPSPPDVITGVTLISTPPSSDSVSCGNDLEIFFLPLLELQKKVACRIEGEIYSHVQQFKNTPMSRLVEKEYREYSSLWN